MKKISDVFSSSYQPISFEMFPPKGDLTLEQAREVVKGLAPLAPDFVSVTYSAGGSGNSQATAKIAQMIQEKHGIPAVAHLTCINSGRREVAQVLSNLAAEDVENVLALRGDRVPGAQPPDAYPHASDLVRAIRASGDFYVAGACYPEGHAECASLAEDIEHLKEKADAGVGHLMTQLFFDNARFYRFMNLLRKKGVALPVQAGVMPIVSARQIERTVALSSASLPPEFTKMISRWDGDEASMFDAGVDYAVRQLRDLIEGGVDGVHLYAMNRPQVARLVWEGIRDLLEAPPC